MGKDIAETTVRLDMPITFSAQKTGSRDSERWYGHPVRRNVYVDRNNDLSGFIVGT